MTNKANEAEWRELTDAELETVCAGKMQAPPVIVRNRPAAPSFRGAVAAGTPPAAGPAKAPRCSGPWCA